MAADNAPLRTLAKWVAPLRRVCVLFSVPPSDESQAPSQDDERAALQELAACMAPMIRQLPPAYREAVTLADLEGVSQADAAARVGVSTSGMKSRVQRGR